MEQNDNALQVKETNNQQLPNETKKKKKKLKNHLVTNEKYQQLNLKHDETS